MARPLRLHYRGAIYHVTVRGVEQRPLFADDADRQRFLDRLGEAVAECGTRLYLYCLMRNHVHLLIETPRANVSAFMHKVQTAYSVYFNRRHQRTGHLMQGRYGAVLVQGDEHLLRLSRYVHLNPVWVGEWKDAGTEARRAALRAYRWSSYRGYAGLVNPAEFVTEGPLLRLVGGAGRLRRRRYCQFVETGLARSGADVEAMAKGEGLGIGDAEFQERLRGLHATLAKRVRRPEDVSLRKVEAVCDPGDVLKAVADAFGLSVEGLRRRQYKCLARAAAAYGLGRYAGMTQRDIGVLLRMGSGSAVCQQLQGLRRARADDCALADRMAALASRLSGLQASSAIS